MIPESTLQRKVQVNMIVEVELAGAHKASLNSLLGFPSALCQGPTVWLAMLPRSLGA